MSAHGEKAALRLAALARRHALPPKVQNDFADRLALEGVALARKAMVRTVAAYCAMRDEADPSLMTQALAYHEFAVALPCIVAPQHPLLFRHWTPRDRLVEGPFGTREPSARLPEITPELLFVPLAAFDRRGGRIGYGGGFYDRTLRDLRRIRPITTIGVAFATQEVENVPTEPHDIALDFVLTETEFISCKAA